MIQKQKVTLSWNLEIMAVRMGRGLGGETFRVPSLTYVECEPQGKGRGWLPMGMWWQSQC